MSSAALDIATGSPSTIARTRVTRGERLVWAARAVRRRPNLGSLKVVAFGLLMAGFGALWSLFAWAGTADAGGLWRFFPLFGFTFVAIGLAIATAPLWLGGIGGATIYALTDQRAFMMYGRRGRIVRSTALDQMGDLLMNEQPDGVGDITFGDVLTAEVGQRRSRILGLFGVADVRRVRDLIEREKARAASAAAEERASS